MPETNEMEIVGRTSIPITLLVIVGYFARNVLTRVITYKIIADCTDPGLTPSPTPVTFA